MNKDWLDSIREKMEDFEESAPEGLWESIESSLGAPAPRKKVIFAWVWRSVAAAAAVAAVVVGVQIVQNGWRSSKDPNNYIQLTNAGSDAGSNQENQDSPKTIPSSSVSHGILAPSDASSSSRLIASAGVSAAKGSPAHQVTRPPVQPSEETIGQVQDEDSRESLVEVRSGDERKDEVSAALPEDHEGEDWSGYMSASVEDGPSGRGRFGVKLSVGGGAVDSETSSTFDTRQFYHGAPSNQIVTDFSGARRPMFAAQAPSVTNTVEHKRPVRAELTVRVPLYGRLGVETGLAYTILRSTFGTSSGTTRSNEYQTLRYLGVPVNLTADVVSSRFVTVYLSGGVMAGKCISGNVRTTTVNALTGENLNEPTSTGISVDPWLYSLNAAGGIQFNATSNLGLYAAPGISYHFDDKSDVQTFYKEHPLDFILSFGLRYNFK